MSGREQALQWLGKRGDAAPVFLPGEIPNDILSTLRRLGLVLGVPGGVAVVRSPMDDAAGVLRALVWPIVEALTQRYAPAVVERDSAVRLYLGRTEPGAEIRIRQTGGTRWRSEIADGVVVRVERGEVSGGESVLVGEATIPVDPPETVLLTLSLAFLRAELHDVAVWLKSLVLSLPAMTEAYRRQPRPVVLKRLEHIARDVGNERLADLLARVVSEEQTVRIGRDRTGVGRELIVPRLVVESKTTRQPWLDRLRVAVRASVVQIEGVQEELEMPGPSKRLGDLLKDARSAKAYDAYHSSSIEGYRIGHNEVAALLGGDDDRTVDTEDLRSKLAILGYGAAFATLVDRMAERGGAVALHRDLALDLYGDLFTPSVEAGIVSAEALRGWRNGPVFIRDTLFVPPRPEKVPRMIDLLSDELEGIHPSRGVLRATLVHLWFVWIHPFPDGNGRVARFLMNAALLRGGVPWLTIRVEQRAEYFAALRAAQLEDDYRPFGRFIAASLSEGTRE